MTFKATTKIAITKSQLRGWEVQCCLARNDRSRQRPQREGEASFSHEASLPDPDKLFNTGLEGKVWRAIDFFQGDKINERALKNLVLAAVDYNQSKLKRKVPKSKK
jgi:hypothetical protein